MGALGGLDRTDGPGTRKKRDDRAMAPARQANPSVRLSKPCNLQQEKDSHITNFIPFFHRRARLATSYHGLLALASAVN